MGFISGILLATGIEYRPTDPDGIDRFITDYCAMHPLDKIIQATNALLDQLRVRR
jgi:hypothetical protein